MLPKDLGYTGPTVAPEQWLSHGMPTETTAGHDEITDGSHFPRDVAVLLDAKRSYLQSVAMIGQSTREKRQAMGSPTQQVFFTEDNAWRGHQRRLMMLKGAYAVRAETAQGKHIPGRAVNTYTTYEEHVASLSELEQTLQIKMGQYLGNQTDEILHDEAMAAGRDLRTAYDRQFRLLGRLQRQLLFTPTLLGGTPAAQLADYKAALHTQRDVVIPHNPEVLRSENVMAVLGEIQQRLGITSDHPLKNIMHRLGVIRMRDFRGDGYRLVALPTSYVRSLLVTREQLYQAQYVAAMAKAKGDMYKAYVAQEMIETTSQKEAALWQEISQMPLQTTSVLGEGVRRMTNAVKSRVQIA